MPGRVTLGSTLGDWLQRAGSQAMPTMLTMQELSDAKWRKQQAENERVAEEAYRKQQQTNFETIQNRLTANEQADQLYRVQDRMADTLDRGEQLVQHQREVTANNLFRDKEFEQNKSYQNAMLDISRTKAETKAPPTGRAGVDYPVPVGQRNTILNFNARQRRVYDPKTARMVDPARTEAYDDSVMSMAGAGLWPEAQKPNTLDRLLSSGRRGGPLASFAEPLMSAVADLNPPPDWKGTPEQWQDYLRRKQAQQGR